MLKNIGLCISIMALLACSNDPSDSTLTQRSYEGVLVDADTAEPVVGALVSLDGVDASSLSSSSGEFRVDGIGLDRCQTLTILAEGFDSAATVVDTAPDSTDQQACSSTKRNGNNQHGVKRSDAPAVIELGEPAIDSEWVAEANCQNPALPVRGMVSKLDRRTFLHDIIFLLDTSNSTGADSGLDFNGDGVTETLLEGFTHAAARIAESVGSSNPRIGVVKFGRQFAENAPDGQISDGPLVSEQTRLVLAPSTRLRDVVDALDLVVLESSVGATHTAAGIDLAREALVAAGDRTVGRGRGGGSVSVTPLKSIVLFTDGIPTLPVEPGETQQPRDRRETIAAAQRAGAAGVRVFPIVIDPVDAGHRRLTTMPAVQAASGAPAPFRRIGRDRLDFLNDPTLIPPLSGVRDVTVQVGNRITPLTVLADGQFSGLIPIQLGSQELRLRAHSGDPNRFAARDLSVTLHAAGTTRSLADLTANTQPIANLDSLADATGAQITGDELLQALQQVLPGARPLSGVETWVPDSDEITVHFRFQSAGYRSELGYFRYNPDNPPTSSAQVIANLTSANRIVNTGDLGQGDLDDVRQVSISRGPNEEIGFYLIPNGSLAQAQAGTAPNAPLYTVAALNPGGFSQHISLYDTDTDRLVFAVEDISLTLQRSDRDFNDIAFDVSGLRSSLRRLGCRSGP